MKTQLETRPRTLIDLNGSMSESPCSRQLRSEVSDKWDEQVLRIGETIVMKKPSKQLIAEVPRSVTKVGMTIGIDLGDVWSHYCTINEDGEVVDRGRFRTTLSGVEKWFTDVPRARVAMETGTHSIWISEQLRELGHEVIVANVRELRAISHSDRKSDTVDAEKIARYARLDPETLRMDGDVRGDGLVCFEQADARAIGVDADGPRVDC